MEFKRLAEIRESCRDFSDRPVAREEVLAILEAVRQSPSACNSQPWRFIVCDGETGAEIAAATQNPLLPINRWTGKAPCLVAVCETPAKLMKGATVPSQHYAQMDVGIATAAFTFAAADKGISTCIIGSFDEDKIKNLLSIPENVTVRLVLAVGYGTSENPRAKKRKTLEEITGLNRW